MKACIMSWLLCWWCNVHVSVKPSLVTDPTQLFFFISFCSDYVHINQHEGNVNRLLPGFSAADNLWTARVHHIRVLAEDRLALELLPGLQAWQQMRRRLLMHKDMWIQLTEFQRIYYKICSRSHGRKMLTLAGSHTAGHQHGRWGLLLHFTAIRFWCNSLGMRPGQPQRQGSAGLAVQNPSAHLNLLLHSPPAEPKHQGNKTSTPRRSATSLLWKILVPRRRPRPEPVWSLLSRETPVSPELWWR